MTIEKLKFNTKERKMKINGKEKKLALNLAWELCLKMWKWVAEQVDKTPRQSVGILKEEWLKLNNIEDVDKDCFFCEYDGQDGDCSNCPAKLIDADFSCCMPNYHYLQHPKAFYAKIVELNKIRLKEAKRGVK